MPTEHDFVLEADHTPGAPDATASSTAPDATASGIAPDAVASAPVQHAATSPAQHAAAPSGPSSSSYAPPCAPACAASCALSGTLGTSLLERLVAALTPKPFRKRHPVLFWGGLIVLLLAFVGGMVSTADDGMGSGDGFAVVRVEGPIMDTRSLLTWIAKIRKNNNIKGVLLRIDSPGGGAAASQELHDALKVLDAVKPVVASMGSTAASGGLMVAMAARQVVANPSTVTGSIGVRMDIPQLQGLLEKIGVNKETLTTGRYKDAGSPTRPLREEERAYFDRVLQDMHTQFVTLVAQGRKLPEATVRAFADGRIMTGREAHARHLVDSLGGQETAVALLAAATGMPATTRLVEMPKKSDLMREMLEGLLGVDLTTGHSAPAFVFRLF